MDTSEYDKKIENLENQIKDIKKDMKTVHAEFIDLTGEFVSEWSKNKIEEYAKEIKPNITKKHAQDGKFPKFKSDFKKLINTLPSTVNDTFNDNTYWEHKKSLNSLKENHYRNHISSDDLKNEINNSLKRIMGKTGQFLSDYNYYTNEDFSWGWKDSPYGKIYDYKFEWTNEMKASIKNYVNLQNELDDLVWELKIVEKERDKSEVDELWDSH